MSFSIVSDVLITLAVLVLIGFGISALVQLKKTLVRIDTTISDIHKDVQPLLADMHQTVTQLNIELERVDDIVLTVRDVGDKVSATTRVVNEVISSPLIKAASVSAGAKEAIRRLVSKK